MSSEFKVTLSNKVSNINFDDLIPYCIFPNSFIRNGKIPAQQRILFEILCTFDFMDKDGKRKGWCDPSLETLSDYMGLSIRAVQIHLKRLVEAGMVTVIYRNCSIEGRKSSIYVLNILPGLSDADRLRIAATRNIEVKNAISGLNTIKVQTTEGMQHISEEEFDLQYIVTGEHSSEIIEGEIADPEDIISNEAEQDVSVFEQEGLDNVKAKTVQDNKSNVQDTEDFEISFKAPKTPINIKTREEKIKAMQDERWSDKDPVVRILVGNFGDIKPMDYCKYFKHKYELQYPGEKLVIDRIKDTAAIKNRLKDLEPEMLVKVIDYYIYNYQKLFYNEEYRRPKIYQLGIAWVFNKLLENFYYAEKARVEAEPIPVQNDSFKRQVF
jgi:DNA-binding transcriptional ArsR family regulator